MLGPQGRRGEVAAELHTSFPERFTDRQELSALSTDGSRRELQLEEHWFHKGMVILKFAGVESISQAELLVGTELQIPSEHRAELEAGAAYVSDLAGCSVFNHGSLIGTVTDVHFGAGEAPLLVIKRDAQELLVPFAAEFLRSSDVAAKRIEVELPEGLLELQSPLSDEERQQQKLEAEATRKAGERRRGHK